MLRARRDFEALQDRGRAVSDRLLSVRYLPNGSDGDRFGISASRRVGNAVTRNRARRRVRGILRGSPGLGGADVLVILRPAGADATFAQLRDSLTRSLAEVRSGSVGESGR